MAQWRGRQEISVAGYARPGRGTDAQSPQYYITGSQEECAVLDRKVTFADNVIEYSNNCRSVR